MTSGALTPALQLRRINAAIARLFGPDDTRTIEAVVDIYWLFMRHTEGWETFRRQPDLGKWILRLPRDQEVVLARAEEVLPLLRDGRARLAKLTNLATPRAAADAAIVVYCSGAEREGLGALLRDELGWSVSWKTNRETFMERWPPRR